MGDTSSTKAIKVEVTGDVVALTTPGSYKVIYNCEDLHGNAAVTRTRTIVVRDTIARKLTSKITRKIFFNKKQVERVDTRKTGTYRIVYSVKDRSGNKATRMTRLVTVIDTLAPVITLQLKSQVHTRRNNKKGINGVKNPANNSPFQHRLKALDFHGGKEQNKF